MIVYDQVAGGGIEDDPIPARDFRGPHLLSITDSFRSWGCGFSLAHSLQSAKLQLWDQNPAISSQGER